MNIDFYAINDKALKEYRDYIRERLWTLRFKNVRRNIIVLTLIVIMSQLAMMHSLRIPSSVLLASFLTGLLAFVMTDLIISFRELRQQQKRLHLLLSNQD